MTVDHVVLKQEGYIVVGRKDHMITSQGYRIELGEMWTIIHSPPQVQDAAVIAASDELIGNRIRVHGAMKGESTISASDPQKSCIDRMPRYMITESAIQTKFLYKTAPERWTVERYFTRDKIEGGIRSGKNQRENQEIHCRRYSFRTEGIGDRF